MMVAPCYSRNVLVGLGRSIKSKQLIYPARRIPLAAKATATAVVAMRLPTRTYANASNNIAEPQKLFNQQRRGSDASSDFVKIVEVGPRDGLQNEKEIVPTDTKIELIERLSKTGLKVIEAGSFVAAKWVPQMADSSKILEHLNAKHPSSSVTFPFLVPNARGLEPAINLHAKEISIFASASEGFSRKNINCTIDESLERYKPVVRSALDHGMKVRGYVSMVIACPYDGPTSPQKVVEVSQKLLDMGCYEISLGDTIGVGTPVDVHRMLSAHQASGIPMEKVACHFHDTYGQAIVNCVTGLYSGVRVFDSSVAGLGGCPYAKGATGNVSTEDLVYTLHGLGLKTGINLDLLAETGGWISNAIGRKNNSKVGPALLAKK